MMKPLKIAELFYSIQGEGARAGQPSIFIRLSGCDLACGFCDTEFESGREMSCEELLAYAEKQGGCRWIIWTGGEPCLQLAPEHVAFFHEAAYLQAMETNGNHRPPPGLDWIACSPKVAEHVLEKNFPDGVDELRYVRHSGQPGIPEPRIEAKRYFLSPMFKGNQPDPENVRHCLRLCLENPRWNLSMQLHKLLGVL